MTLTLGDALTTASVHWRESKAMLSQARKCVHICGGPNKRACEVTEREAVILLSELATAGLSPKSVACAYRIFRRMLALSGISTVSWPAPRTTPRVKSREALEEASFNELVRYLDRSLFGATADMATLLFHCGLRTKVEAQAEGALEYKEGSEYGTLRIIGKGGHERVIPVVNQRAREVLNSAERIAAIRAVPHYTHDRRWDAAVKALGITTKKPTRHAARHAFATSAYENSGGNLNLVKELMGHANVQTTTGYITNDFKGAVEAVGRKDK